MIKKTFLPLCLFFFFNHLDVRSQNIQYAQKLIKKLTSQPFKGRGYVANGDQIASAFIAKEFKKSGLIPLNDGSYFQDFNLSANTFPGKIEVKIDGNMLETATDYLVDAASPSIKGTFKVISITRAAINTQQKFNAVISNANNCFILLDNGMKNDENAEIQSIILANIKKLKTEEKLNFKGLILCSEEKLTWTSLTYQNARTVIYLNKKHFNPAAVHNITLNIESTFIPNYTTRNVVGMIKGTSRSDSTLVITAHYDHLGLLGRKVYFPGANDNASGTALMLDFARYYSQNKPKYNMVFIAFSGEEIGLLGSKAFVKDPLINLAKIKFLVNFDLAGTGDEGIKVVNGTVFPSQFDKLTKLNDEFKYMPKVEIRGEACKSDHCPFYQEGVPSFFIYTMGGIQAYHDIYDKASTLPLTKYEGYFKLMVKFFQTF